jgi:hypothetical protein
MKIAYFGWEADSLQNSAVQFTVPLLTPITLLGYQFDLSMGSIATPGWFGTAPFGMVLFQASWGNSGQANSDFGPVVYTQVRGTNAPTLHGNPTLGSQVFAEAILKTNPPNAVNKSLIVTGLSIAIPAGAIAMRADHSGFAQDFECQGVLFYEK